MFPRPRKTGRSARLRGPARRPARPGPIAYVLARQRAGRGGRCGVMDSLLALADKHDFRIFAEEMLFRALPAIPRRPARWRRWNGPAPDPERVMVFHSLSKRSNLPGIGGGVRRRRGEVHRAAEAVAQLCRAPLPCPCRRWRPRQGATRPMSRKIARLYRAKYAIADAILGERAGVCRAASGVFTCGCPVADG